VNIILNLPAKEDYPYRMASRSERTPAPGAQKSGFLSAPNVGRREAGLHFEEVDGWEMSVRTLSMDCRQSFPARDCWALLQQTGRGSGSICLGPGVGPKGPEHF
jgi:hypothetical protein